MAEVRGLQPRRRGKLEEGKVVVDEFLADCVAQALAADASERALLLHAAGHNGVAIVTFDMLGSRVQDIHAQLTAYCRGIRKNELPLTDALHLMELMMRAVQQELQQTLQSSVVPVTELGEEEGPAP
jgi:hypothetical protein